jgi:hypothetical protein
VVMVEHRAPAGALPNRRLRSTAVRCKESSQVWSGQRDTPGAEERETLHPETVQGTRPPRTLSGSLSGCVRLINTLTRGCARFTRLTPGYPPCTSPGVTSKRSSVSHETSSGCLGPGLRK